MQSLQGEDRPSIDVDKLAQIENGQAEVRKRRGRQRVRIFGARARQGSLVVPSAFGLQELSLMDQALAIVLKLGIARAAAQCMLVAERDLPVDVRAGT